MNLYSLMRQRAEKSGPIRVGLIGAGKFASMFLTQASRAQGIHVVGIAELNPEIGRAALKKTGWAEERYDAKTLDEACKTGKTAIVASSDDLIKFAPVEVILEVTGNPVVGTAHALKCIENGKHIVMVNVEADCMVGPILAERARKAGVVYAMAYGDQPALICELVDWCRTVGFEVVCAGKGTKYLPEYSKSTPDTVWDHYGFTREQLAKGDFNPKMFNSFLDGTKSAIEMVAVANGTGLIPQDEGLFFPPAGANDIQKILVPKADGGVLTRSGTVEICSCLNRDGSPVERDLRWGVYVTFKALTDYAVQCFSEYGIVTDESGRYASLYRPYHMIGMELGVSIASAVLRGEATGSPVGFIGDVASVAKRDLKAGEVLDGEGGYMVFGKVTSAGTSLKNGLLPLGLAHGVKLKNPIAEGKAVRWDDVEFDASLQAVTIRKELEQRFKNAG
ncbi:MAG: SAF domain-containing protein [Deltaproteobacteria bacterium]|jgi:predicted homoserine dehydrogenase-like protein|nr:SAF domain-containing protein [Deltaproteobacteria bacterium]